MNAANSPRPNRIQVSGAYTRKRRRCWVMLTEDQAHEHMTAKGVRFERIPAEAMQP